MKTAFITGITGQDGAYLSRMLLDKGYTVHGLQRRTSLPTTRRLEALRVTEALGERLFLHYGDLNDTACLFRILAQTAPDEIYNFAAQSDVAVSFAAPDYTLNTNATGAINLLEAIRVLKLDKVRYYQASTSEIFGWVDSPVQNENTPFMPCSPYGVAKLAAFWNTVNYRRGYGMHASNGISFNHESPLRGHMFVTRKITRAVAAIHAGRQDYLTIGNLDSKRDWGHAKDCMQGIWKVLQQDVPDDYVLATGKAYSVREFIEAAFACIRVPIIWEGKGMDEVGKDKNSGTVRVRVDPAFIRPTEIPCLCGDSAKARRILGWEPVIGFAQLVEEMVRTDIDQAGS